MTGRLDAAGLRPLKKISLFTTLMWLGLQATAHEFWLSPNKYWFSPYENGSLRFNVGENFEGENWTGNREKVQQLTHYLPDGRANSIEKELSEIKGDSLTLKELREGTQMIIYHSKNSLIELDAQKFNAYLKEDGLTAAQAYRKEHGGDSLPGKELYQRSVKTIFQVGNFKNDITSNTSTLPLDIVPKSNVYDTGGKQKGNITFTVFFKGEPLKNTLIKVWHKTPGGSTNVSELQTDAKGRFKIAVSYQGTWMVSTVHMLRLTDNPLADWQSYWGSLTWGYGSN